MNYSYNIIIYATVNCITVTQMIFIVLIMIFHTDLFILTFSDPS